MEGLVVKNESHRNFVCKVRSLYAFRETRWKSRGSLSAAAEKVKECHEEYRGAQINMEVFVEG